MQERRKKGFFIILSLAHTHGRGEGVEEEKKGSGREGVEAQLTLRWKLFPSQEERERSTRREKKEGEGKMERMMGDHPDDSAPSHED